MRRSPPASPIPVLSCAALAACVPAPFCRAQSDPTPDKSAYHLGNPVPRSLLREMSTDRPDATESPFTVDAGHAQLEMSLLEFTRDDPRGGRRTDSLAVAPLNFRVGLLNATEAQLMFDPYLREKSEGEPGREGMGDLTLRVKHNLWGNDGGATALALMPFVGFPSGDRDVGRRKVEGGIIVPFAADLPGEWSLGAMAELDLLHDPDAGARRAELVHTVTLGHAIVGELGGYVEYIGVEPLSAADPYRASASLGVTYTVAPNVQLDAGAVVGLSEAAEDLVLFAGFAVRY